MRKFIAMLAAGAMASIVPTTPVLAGGSVIVTDDNCAGFVPRADGGIDADNGIFTTESHQVIKGTTATLTCHFDIPPEKLPSKGMKQNDFTCQKRINGEILTAFDQRMSASPGGRAVLTCKFTLPTITSSPKKK